MNALLPLTALALAASLTAQDILHYKFDEGCGNEAINHAAGSNVGAGTIAGTMNPTFTNGRWNTALAEDNWVSSGWNVGNYTGDLSLSFWLRNRPGNPTAIAFGYMFGVDGPNFRLFTGASGKLFLAGWGGSNLVNVQDLTTQLNAGWVHVAATLDSTTMLGTWYVNGVADPSVTMTAPVNFTGTGFAVGARDSTGSSPSPLEIEEFLMTGRVLSPIEIQVLAASPQAGDGPYGTSCGPTLTSNGTRPALGNANYGLDVQGSANGLAWLLLGSSRCTLAAGTIPLPVDLGTFHPGLRGCSGYVDTDMGDATAALVGGSASFPAPIPNTTSLSGLYAFVQAVTLDVATLQLRSSNPLGLGLGH